VNPLLVIQTEHLDAEPAAWLRERCQLVACGTGDPQFASLLSRAQGLVVRTYSKVDQALLDQAPALKVVARGGVGLENIDVAACRRRGVEVVHTPEANLQAVAEYVIALLMDAIRPRVFLDKPLDDATWRKTRRELSGRKQVSEMTVGILGFGRIGRRVARTVGAMGARVIYHDLLSVPPDFRAGAQPMTRDQLLRECDVLSIHVDARPENAGLVNDAMLSKLRPDVIVINTARGMLVNAVAMAGFLKRNPAALALLDVHEPEPINGDYPLLGVRNAHLSPHLAASTETAQRDMSWVVRDLWRVLTGEEAMYPAPFAE
jgi:phosphoglycerate dehydrogenase-like enzyme